MSSHSHSFFRKNKFRLFLFFRRYPSLPYIIKWLLLSTLVGVCSGSASAFFLVTLDAATTFRQAHTWIILLLPAGGLLIGLLYYYRGKPVEGGNNLLLQTIHHPERPVIPFRMAPFVYLGTIGTHLLGGSAGREGTALQLAGAITDQFTKPLRLIKADRQVLLIAAISAGFGSVFGTPLAGALFGLEAFLTGHIRYHALFPAFASAVIADAVVHLWGVSHTHYSIPAIPSISPVNIVYTVIAGIAFGLTAAFFSKAMHYTGRAFKKCIGYAPLRPVAGGILIVLAVWAIGTDKYSGLGIPTIVQSFNQRLPPYDFFVKLIFTVLTLSAGFKGGEVTPLFFIGAALGNALSFILPLPVGLLSGMGFVAVFAGATNTPLACSLMAMELFGSGCGPYAAIACIVAYLVSGNNSIYSAQVIGEPKHRRFEMHRNKSFEELKSL